VISLIKTNILDHISMFKISEKQSLYLLVFFKDLKFTFIFHARQKTKNGSAHRHVLKRVIVQLSIHLFYIGLSSMKR